MRVVQADEITKVVSELCKKACYVVTDDMRAAFKKAQANESSPLGKDIIGKILQNADLAEKGVAPICQDTGMTVVFVEIGQDVHIEGGYLEDAINAGVADGYVGGYLRKSVVAEPLFERKNTANNTPAVINTRIVPGDKLKIKVAPKGFGSENKSILKMLVPADGIEGVKRVFLEAVKLAGPNACPPMVVGVGIGGTMDKAALLSKLAAVRSVDSRNPDERYAKLEDELLEMARQTGVGPQGMGGDNTAVKVNVEWYPTHIAGLPVAVNINCHAARHADAEI
ncbi:fumarate hydratase [Campylobacter sp. RM9344]|uniref:Fumarate hydratase n=1 Tax=Campylobacter californiensis TaxID=1032243 RepID=A0AAW3ZS99_9BACT|nr:MULTISPECIES: fumarate hydratase [unclassified Campylobacter]MBE2984020.1 fumarate hydratase [Campylobacter sp. RM6883]MBE2987065.1 fumarate hydratase [Campylobacter sp. RM12919]MBE2988963.1 fumarate hydratase [Campylobacter sp. RM12920]MBE2995445.1 fumarate hydratase [Campylobacter sp. RM6913]MBE3022009.1 fumarate hydratase [Campylobacter sp. 7477a]MBE3030239.1 fumarate hydratase [Campylobacter sp. RM9344]